MQRKSNYVCIGWENLRALYANADENERWIVSESFFDDDQIFLSPQSWLRQTFGVDAKCISSNGLAFG
jgi:hypothetical protein